MYLVIAEKPDLGRAIAAAIPGRDNYNKTEQIITKTWKGQPITIVWCYGHLLTLVEPEEYDEKFAGQWKLENLPFFFEDWRLKPKPGKDGKPGTKGRVDQIKKLLAKADTVIHAGDIDDEGQLLVDEVLRYCGYKGKTLRLNTNDTSKEALRKALDNMDDNENHISAGLAAYGRQMSDKTFGYNLTPYYSILNGRTLPVGRVKMPTLGLVVQRDELIEGHQKVTFYTLNATLAVSGENVVCKYTPRKDDPKLQDGRITDKAYIEDIASKLNGASVRDVKITMTEQEEHPPLPFNLVKLYAFCSNKWGLQPGKVRSITQSLREKHHAITYNRTNCQYLSTSMFHEAPQTVAMSAANLGMEQDMFDTTIKSRCFNDANVTEHTAMIPTATKQDLSTFTTDEKRVYEAIARYYLAQFLPPARKAVTKLEAPSAYGGKLTATSTVIIKQGYRALLGGVDLTRTEEDGPAEDEAQGSLSDINPGTYTGLVKSTKINEQETKPLPRYTAATLIADMTSIAKYVTNPAVKELLLQKDKGKKDEHGSIGTPATRDIIVKELIAAGYLREEVKGKKTQLISTQMGREFYHILPDSVRKVDVSAKWWCEQEQIRSGELTPNDMARSVLRTISVIISSGQGAMSNATQYAKGIIGGEAIGKCPKCGGDVFEVAKGWKCVNDGCKFFIFKQSKFFASLGKQLTTKAVQIMLKTNRLAVKNCKSSAGKTYDAVILCDFVSGDYPKYSFADDDQLEAVGVCPLCGGNVVDKGNYFACSKRECKFFVWKSLDWLGKTLTAANMKELLKEQKCAMHGCKSKSDPTKKYDCYITIDWSGEKVSISRGDFINGKRKKR